MLIPEDKIVTSKPQTPHTKGKESALSDAHKGMKMRSTIVRNQTNKFVP